ncbi:hypothetical protein HZY97_20130 [Sphingomonas sp. R-74633]|uniref:hypothetical protein n=1 Tax=Sphingomonas sp. R-74633 TaxID=2751188 RepID=UPI0015D1219C|nr:hypothetical protein [Sphingomonas sp. R-74633]NYT43094.1 hypothetical protein [Sphingomonas sp. R-74633]
MTPREQLIAYLATLAALVIVLLGAMIIAALSENIIGKMEAFGLGTVTGGLIGVLRIPTSRQVTVDNPPTEPIPVEPGAN